MRSSTRSWWLCDEEEVISLHSSKCAPRILPNGELAGFPADRGYAELPRIPLPKLFGNSELIPNRGYEAAKRGQRSPDRLPLGAKEECSRHLLLFSKQFLHALR